MEGATTSIVYEPSFDFANIHFYTANCNHFDASLTQLALTKRVFYFCRVSAPCFIYILQVSNELLK